MPVEIGIRGVDQLLGVENQSLSDWLGRLVVLESAMLFEKW